MSHDKFWNKNTNFYHNALASLYKQDTNTKKGTVIDNFNQ